MLERGYNPGRGMKDVKRYRLPESQARAVSDRAVQIVREDFQVRGWTSGSHVQGVVREGYPGLRVTRKHLRYQNDGTNPFVMWSLEGKVVPLPSGPIVATRVGQPGWAYMPDGTRIWRDQRWRHPGLVAQKFLEKAMAQAVEEQREAIKKDVLDRLKGKKRGS